MEENIIFPKAGGIFCFSHLRGDESARCSQQGGEKHRTRSFICAHNAASCSFLRGLGQEEEFWASLDPPTRPREDLAPAVELREAFEFCPVPLSQPLRAHGSSCWSRDAALATLWKNKIKLKNTFSQLTWISALKGALIPHPQ